MSQEQVNLSVPFTAVDSVTGEVRYSGTASEPQVLANETTTIIEGVIHPHDGWVEEGVFHARPARPSHHHEWDWGTKAWHDPRTLQDLRDQRWEVIKKAREAAKVAPTMSTPYGVVDADAKALENIKSTLLGMQSVIALGGTPGPITWTMADDSDQELTYAQLSEIALLLLGRGNVAHERARQLRAQIDAAQTPEEVAAVVW